jgi:AcrR family transcriptional regulator
LDERPLREITVGDVVQRAGVSRRAFYNNYDSMEELVADAFNESMPRLIAGLGGRTDAREVVWTLLDNFHALLLHLASHPRLAAEYLRQIGSVPYYSGVWEQGVQTQLSYYADRFGDEGHLPYRWVANYTMSGWYGLMRSWMAEGMRQPAADVARAGILLNLQCEALLGDGCIDASWRAAVDEWQPER